jgi:hypothetical protein
MVAAAMDRGIIAIITKGSKQKQQEARSKA